MNEQYRGVSTFANRTVTTPINSMFEPMHSINIHEQSNDEMPSFILYYTHSHTLILIQFTDVAATERLWKAEKEEEEEGAEAEKKTTEKVLQVETYARTHNQFLNLSIVKQYVRHDKPQYVDVNRVKRKKKYKVSKNEEK